MEILNTGIIFVLGATIGSFLNVLIYRLNTGMSIVKGSSRCFSCNKKLSWFELIPVFSFIFQKGKCRSCHAKISKQYILVEVSTGVLFVFASMSTFFNLLNFTNDTFFRFTIFATVASLLVVLFVYDLKHKILPSSILYSFVALSFFYGLFIYVTKERYLIDLFAGFIVALPTFLLWFVSKGRWIGFADSILFLGGGFLLGLALGVQVFLFSFWTGALVAIILTKLLPGRFSLKSEIPFGPFIVVTILFFLFTQNDILGVSKLYELFK